MGKALLLLIIFFPLAVSQAWCSYANTPPREMACSGNIVYFSASVNPYGEELWKSDGTASGTVMVKDINPGKNSSTPCYLTVINGTLFFAADDGEHGVELWKSDGTAQGTVMVKDMAPGGKGSYPYQMTVFNGALFFVAEDSTHHREVCRSDGAREGTFRLKEIWPNQGYGSQPSKLAVCGNSLYFLASDESGPSCLWKTDGTQVGTMKVTDETGGFIQICNLWSAKNYLCFSGYKGNAGLWRGDATASGAIKVQCIHPDASPWLQDEFTMLDDGSFCFIAWDGKKNKELWRSDGTTSGTRKVLKSDGASIFATGLEKANGTLFFCDNEAFGNLWKIDSQTKLAVMVKNIKVDISDSGRRYLKGVNELLYFSASDAAHGTEIWKSDGTEQGTVMVKDINSAPQSSSVPQVLTNCNGVLFFVAYNHITPGPKLYRSDGTERGTIMLLDTYVDSSTSAQPK